MGKKDRAVNVKDVKKAERERRQRLESRQRSLISEEVSLADARRELLSAGPWIPGLELVINALIGFSDAIADESILDRRIRAPVVGRRARGDGRQLLRLRHLRRRQLAGVPALQGRPLLRPGLPPRGLEAPQAALRAGGREARARREATGLGPSYV
jgi:hypothetical protein